eukprot:364759-Chlamydomonas_euryale.AAC.34
MACSPARRQSRSSTPTYHSAPNPSPDSSRQSPPRAFIDRKPIATLSPARHQNHSSTPTYNSTPNLSLNACRQSPPRTFIDRKLIDGTLASTASNSCATW